MSRAIVCAILAAAFVLLAQAGTITHYTYATEGCTGSPTATTTHQSGVCNLGAEYTCHSSGERCLKIDTVELNSTAGNRRVSEVVKKVGGGSSCGGTVLTSSVFVCDLCTGGEMGPSTTAKGCSGDHPRIVTCSSGDCTSCTTDGRDLTVGCTINGTVGIDVQVVSCGAVVLKDYTNFQSCSGSIVVQTVMPAGMCFGFEKWSC